MKFVLEALGNSGEDILRMAPQQLPSWHIQNAVRKRQLKAPRAEAGDFTDSYLAAFVLYIDHVIVDRRTHEYLSQARRRDALGLRFGMTSKLSHYSDLVSVLDSPRAGT